MYDSVFVQNGVRAACRDKGSLLDTIRSEGVKAVCKVGSFSDELPKRGAAASLSSPPPPRKSGSARQRAGLSIPPECVARVLLAAEPRVQLSPMACVYAAAASECVANFMFEHLELPLEHNPFGDALVVLPAHVFAAVASNTDLRNLLGAPGAGAGGCEPVLCEGEADGPIPSWLREQHCPEDASGDDDEAPWTDLPSWRDESLAWELGDMALLPLRTACEACVLVVETRVAEAASATREAGAGLDDVAALQLEKTGREALAAARWLRAIKSFEDAGASVADDSSTVAATGASSSVDLPASLRLSPASESRLLELLGRVDACL